MHVKQFGHAVGEPVLHLPGVAESLTSHELLYGVAFLPLVARGLISTDMDELCAREKFADFGEYAAEEVHSYAFGGVCVGQYPPGGGHAWGVAGYITVAQFGVSGNSGTGVPRHLDLGNDCNSQAVGIVDDMAHLLLGEIERSRGVPIALFMVSEGRGFAAV